jgi:hypothetical protein
MAFGKAFKTRKEAYAYLKKMRDKGRTDPKFTVRKMSKKIHPRRKNLFHVGSLLDFLNFA